MQYWTVSHKHMAKRMDEIRKAKTKILTTQIQGKPALTLRTIIGWTASRIYSITWHCCLKGSGICSVRHRYKLVCSFSLEVIRNVGLAMLLLSTYGFLFFLSNNDSPGKSLQFDLCHYLPLTYYKFSEYWRKVVPYVLKKFRLIVMVVGHYIMFFTLLQHEQTFVHIYIHTLLRRIMLTYKIMLFILNYLWFKFVPFVFSSALDSFYFHAENKQKKKRIVPRIDP